MNFSDFLRAAALACPALLTAAVVGTNPPSQSVTAERIAQLPTAEQPPWRDYLDRSARLHAAEVASFMAELKAHQLTSPTSPPGGRNTLGLNRPAEWFRGDDAKKAADNVITFQTPSGGWSKGMDLASHARAPGERYAPGNTSPLAEGADDNDAPRDLSWHYVGTFDNNATISPLRFLARVATARGAQGGEPYCAAVQRGLDYIFAAQFPNGGFPQVFPLEGGYHDSITYNDNALINILELLRDVAVPKPDFAFVSAEQRTRATAAIERAIGCILATQIVVDGRRTVWCQQHDALTLAPTSARNYEMPSQSAGESNSLMGFLMSLPSPRPEVVTAVHAAAAWFKKTELRDVTWGSAPDGSGRTLLKSPGAGPLWARYYQIGTDKPIFGDRDKTIHDDVNEISKERRNGYAWFNDSPANALKSYAKWAPKHPAK